MWRVILFIIILVSFLCAVENGVCDTHKKNDSQITKEMIEKYYSIEEKYEKHAPEFYYKLFSPTASRIIAITSLVVSFVLLIRTRNPRIFIPFYLIAFIFAYLIPILKKLLSIE